jgi:hypothetical protein
MCNFILRVRICQTKLPPAPVVISLLHPNIAVLNMIIGWRWRESNPRPKQF